MLSEITDKETEQREKVIEIARTWIGTPYHHMGRVKGVGCDCATLLCEVYEEAGIVSHIDLEFYPPDWALHRNEERYLKSILQYAFQTDTPQKGDIALYRFGRVVSHASIIIEYPKVIHCCKDGVIEDFEGSGRLPVERRVGFYSHWRQT